MSTATEPTVSISLTCKPSDEAMAFYTKALGAKELYRIPMPDGSIAHGEFMIGNTRLFISGEAPQSHAFAMAPGASASCVFSVATEDCDSAFKQAVDAGATPLTEPQNFFWGSRNASVRDPYGYRWSFAQRIEKLTPEELAERAKKFMGGGQS
jgi:PhnB protein